jgi:hypothetical protein
VVDNLPELLFSIFVIYAASGYVYWVVTRLQRKSAPRPPPPSTPPDGR